MTEKSEKRNLSQLFQTLVEFTDAIHWEMDLKTMRFTYVSPQIEKILGYPPSHWTTFDSWARSLYPDDRDWAVDFCKAKVLQAEHHELLYRVVASDDKIVWLREIVSVISENGAPAKLIGVMFDVTGQQKTKHALRHSERIYRDLVEMTGAVHWEVDIASLQFTYISPQIESLLGYPLEEWTGFEYWVGRIHPDDAGWAPQYCNTETARGKDHVFEYRMIHRNGTTVWVKDIVHVVMGDHGPQKLQGIFVDITGSKQEHLISKAVGDLAAALLSETSLEEIAKLTLSRARELTASEHGYVSAIDQDSGDNISYTLTQMMGDPCIMRGDDQRIRFPVGKDGKYPGLWGCSLNEKEPMFTNDPSGHENAKGLPEGHIPLQNFLSAPALYGGELVGQIALANSATDYSEKDLDSVVRLADIYAIAVQRAKAEKMLLDSLREKEVLLKEVHHRVKNNMAVIASLLNLQSAYVRDPEDLSMLRESQGRIRAMALVHEQLYRSENISRIDVHSYMVSLVESIRKSKLTSAKIKVIFDIEDVELEMDVLIPCGLIVNEIVTNAFKHAFKGGGKPQLAVKLRSVGGNDVQLAISDNGIGLPEEFDIDASAGLGLKLVTALCSQIWAAMEYRSDNGTEFVLTFPREIPHSKA